MTADLYGQAMSWAEISPCGTYRYLLGRRVGEGKRTALFVMLNPSTADALVDDPTIRRCIGFARREGCGVLEVVNLFAYRTTDPAALRSASEPVGPANDQFIEQAVRRTDLVVVAWGIVPRRLVRRSSEIGRAIYDHLPAHGQRGPFSLGTTADGSPRHPLYVRADRALEQWGHGTRERASNAEESSPIMATRRESSWRTTGPSGRARPPGRPTTA
jgi:hypothetical protein